MSEFDNPYGVFALEQRFKETGSLIEHLLIMADFLEYQVNQIICAEFPDNRLLGIAQKANFSPEQRLSFAVGCVSTVLSLDDLDGDAVVYFLGRVNEIYTLRRMLPTLGQADIEARVKRLYHVNKGDEESWKIITTVIEAFNDVPGNPSDLPATDLFDRFAIPIYNFMIDFVDEYQGVINDLKLESGGSDDGGLMDSEDDDGA